MIWEFEQSHLCPVGWPDPYGRGEFFIEPLEKGLAATEAEQGRVPWCITDRPPPDPLLWEGHRPWTQVRLLQVGGCTVALECSAGGSGIISVGLVPGWAETTLADHTAQ